MMVPALPLGIQSGFLLLVLVLYTTITRALLKRGPKFAPLVTIVAFWLTITAVLSIAGFFLDFASLPPRIPIFVAVQTVFLVYAICFSRWRDELAAIPQRWLIGLQVFRVPVELLLAALASEGVLAPEMTFHGRNFDILAGASAPLVAWALSRKGSRGLVVAWNLLGLALLLNVVGTGMLSAPYRTQVFRLSVENYVLGLFPVTWLPLFLVPLALALHLISLRAAVRSASGPRAWTSQGL